MKKATRLRNNRIEQQLSLLRDFWNLEENLWKAWDEVSGTQTAYYNYLYEVGFIDDNRRLTEDAP